MTTSLQTTFAGLKLKNPIIAASSGLTNSINKIIELENSGVGAIVLKSLFEEQIENHSEKLSQIAGRASNYIYGPGMPRTFFIGTKILL
jgi:dihydroorotate dehydrogenase (fumarate)